MGGRKTVAKLPISAQLCLEQHRRYLSKKERKDSVNNLMSKQNKRSEFPHHVVIFVDELNKYASTDSSKSSSILQHLLEVAERGRSSGVILFGAGQFLSYIHPRVKGNCATQAFGRTSATEIVQEDFKLVPSAYKGMLTRMKQGEYIIQNPTLRSMLKIKFPLPIYQYSNEDPTTNKQ